MTGDKIQPLTDAELCFITWMPTSIDELQCAADALKKAYRELRTAYEQRHPTEKGHAT